MKHIIRVSKNRMLGIMLVCALCIVSRGQSQISIIVGKSVRHTVDVLQMRQMFSGAKLTWTNGEKVVIADQSDAAIGKKFYALFTGKTISQVRLEWMKLVLSGQASAPTKCMNDAAVKTYVRENPNAVGFISSSSVDESVKELYRVNETDKYE